MKGHHEKGIFRYFFFHIIYPFHAIHALLTGRARVSDPPSGAYQKIIHSMIHSDLMTIIQNLNPLLRSLFFLHKP